MPPVLVLVPARGGSRGIPRKNVRLFLGRPLLTWTVETAIASGAADRVVVSTEDDEVAAAAADAGAEVLPRPPELSCDDVPTADVVRHALQTLAERDGYVPEHVLVLEPTSPTRRPDHVRQALRLLEAGADSVATVSRVPHHFVPEKLVEVAADGTMRGLDATPLAAMMHRRQELEERWALDGLIFGCRSELVLRDPPTLWGERVAALRVDERYRVDLDAPEDWAPAEARMRELTSWSSDR